MSREIKFRAWNGWLEKFEKDFEIRREGDRLTFWIDDNENEECVQLGDIQQFTGLKDKNGVEIYEGDVVRINSDSFLDSKVIFEHGCFKLIEIRLGDSEAFNHFRERQLRIIGNIYENPELLK